MQSVAVNYSNFINLTFLSLLSVNKNTETSALSQGLSRAIDEIFVKNHIEFDFHIFDQMLSASFDYVKTIDITSVESRIVNEILAKNKANYVCAVNFTTNPKEIERSAVILARGLTEFATILMQFNKFEDSARITSVTSTVLVYLHSEEITSEYLEVFRGNVCVEINKIKSTLNVFVAINTPTGFDLMANIIVKHEGNSGCVFRNKYEVINTFDNRTLKWTGNFDKLSSKMRTKNFENYLLRASLECNIKYECYVDKFDGRPKGVFIDLLETVAQHGNFKVRYQFGDFNKPTPLSDQRLAKVDHFQTHFSSIHSKTTSLSFVSAVFLTTSFYEEQFKFIIPPPESYTSYKKLTMPFDTTTWIILLVTFLVAFITIVIVNRLSTSAQILVYDVNVKMPGYNVVSIFFGIGQTQLPSSNHPRIILMLFILFCLIFRTAYQSVLYELITTDVHKPLPTKIIELVDRNYTLYRINSLHNDLMKIHLTTKLRGGGDEMRCENNL